MAIKSHYEVLRYGSLIYLVNCTVKPGVVEAGFAYFAGNSPDYFSLRDEAGYHKIVSVFIPEKARGSAHPVVLGDFDSPIVLTRID